MCGLAVAPEVVEEMTDSAADHVIEVPKARSKCCAYSRAAVSTFSVRPVNAATEVGRFSA
jgi:hypothetical protein